MKIRSKLPHPRPNLKHHTAETPSGNILAGQVRGIKQFLQAKQIVKHTNYTSNSTFELDINSHGQHDYTLADASNREPNALALSELSELVIDHDESVNKKRKHEEQSPEIIKTSLTPVSRSEDREVCEVSVNSMNTQAQVQTTPKRYKMMEDQKSMDTSEYTENEDLYSFLQQQGIEENSKVIDVRTVLKMFQRLTADLSSTPKLEKWKNQLKSGH